MSIYQTTVVMRKTICVLAVIGLSLARGLHPPASAEVPFEEFTKLPLYGNLKISPTGEYLAATVHNDDGQMSLVIMNMRSNEVTATIRGFGRDFINHYIWANDERIVASLGRQYGSLDATQWAIDTSLQQTVYAFTVAPTAVMRP